MSAEARYKAALERILMLGQNTESWSGACSIAEEALGNEIDYTIDNPKLAEYLAARIPVVEMRTPKDAA